MHSNFFTIMHLDICSGINKFDNFEFFLASLPLNLHCIVISDSCFFNRTFSAKFDINDSNIVFSSSVIPGGGGTAPAT